MYLSDIISACFRKFHFSDCYHIKVYKGLSPELREKIFLFYLIIVSYLSDLETGLGLYSNSLSLSKRIIDNIHTNRFS